MDSFGIAFFFFWDHLSDDNDVVHVNSVTKSFMYLQVSGSVQISYPERPLLST